MRKLLPLLIVPLLMSGCVHYRTIYVPAEDKIEAIKWNDKEGYFVPKSKMHEITEAYVKYKYYYKKYGPIGEDYKE